MATFTEEIFIESFVFCTVHKASLENCFSNVAVRTIGKLSFL